MKFIIVSIFLIILYCCSNPSYKTAELLKKWQNKTITFPTLFNLKIYNHDTTNLFCSSSTYKLLTYIESDECNACKLQLSKWKKLKKEVDSVTSGKTALLLFVHATMSSELIQIINENSFDYPIFFDTQDSLNKLNHFPEDERFHTFLLDSNNRVKVIGNPVHNPKIKELYLKVITGDTLPKKEISKTTVSYEVTSYYLGEIKVKESRDTTFLIENTGKYPLIVMDITTSCGCAIPRFNKKPIKPGDTFKFSVKMKPDDIGHFEKTVSVYCNTSDSPIRFKLKGTARE